MPTLSTVLNFFGVSLLLALTPGPDNLFVLVQSMQRGVRVGLAVVLGLCLGLLVHTSAIALGLAAVLAAQPLAFRVLQMLGALYLAWLAWQALRPRPQHTNNPEPVTSADTTHTRTLARMVGRGLLMNLSNPKVLLFFLAFLPQFTHPAQGSIASQIVLLGLVFMLATLLVFGGIACFSGHFAAWLQRHTQAQGWLDTLAGLVFLALALRLVAVEWWSL